METSTLFHFLTALLYHFELNLAEHSSLSMNVSIRSKIVYTNTDVHENLLTTYSSSPSTDFNYIPRSTTYWPLIPSVITNAFRLTDSNCFCSYDRISNLLSCSPSLQNATSYPVSDTNFPLINITLNDCMFSSNHFSVPNIGRKNIDQLRIYDVNRNDYLVLDGTSFSSYSINQLYIIYSYSRPITMLLISSETFSSSSIYLSLHTLYITSCYLITLQKPFSRLFLLETITLRNIDAFSWYDFQQQIVRLPKLRFINIAEGDFPSLNNIFNVLSCKDISSQWILSYRMVQTCSCAYVSFLQTIQRQGVFYQCPNSVTAIDFSADICLFNGVEYLIGSETNFFCNKCRSFQCPNGTACAEAYPSEPTCISLSRCDYNTLQERVPLTPYTKQFLFRESQEYLTVNPNQTLGPQGFNSVATILIDSNRNPSPSSPNDAQMFHQTFSEMLNRPWSPEVYTASLSSPTVLQQLLVSLDGSIKTINNSESIFVFQSQPISTMSLHFPTDMPDQDRLGFKITNDNRISENITQTTSVDETVTSRIFLKIDPSQLNKTKCEPSNTTTNCTNRFSITSLKSPKLFYNTDRIPKYDVISILAPDHNQTVTFYFEQKIITNETSNVSINSTSDSFYDQLDQMLLQGTCMYLNTTSMIWQTDGCITDRQLSNDTSVICTCEHLTMFTVFFSLSCATPSKALEILSWIGCVLSILGLSVTLVMFVVIRQCRKTNDNVNGISSSHSSSSQELRRRIMTKPRRLSMVKSMLFVLCILLIIMNILIFVLTFIKADRNVTCTILSASLYYFTLTAFLWKLCFALQQSLFITNLFQSYWSDRTLLIIYFTITFTLPICPLIVMFVKYPNSTFISSTCNYCWLTREFLLYGLVIPILIIICLNVVFYIYTMVHLCIRNRQQPNLRSTKSEQSRRIQNFKIGLFFAIIMGFSWVLGFLVLIPNSYVQTIGNILFCIVNTLQGFAFSIMTFCMLERKSFRKCCCFWRYKNSDQANGNSSDAIAPQQSLPTSNGADATKSKSIYNSSTYTSSITPSEAYRSLRDVFNHHHHQKKTLPVENDKGNVYSVPTF
ncbi:unnamed protein product [Adineta ricciae]|uniref:G-protein coupled receptors family 2 profile 2 domain-containing protein n=1 Tax=Adineta ricciae TaxID=249248 RepID=A0A813SCF3_ADIRI|nr:unnamed protein product [Adineta ricciae]